jgi:hypothetical protein
MIFFAIIVLVVKFHSQGKAASFWAELGSMFTMYAIPRCLLRLQMRRHPTRLWRQRDSDFSLLWICFALLSALIYYGCAFMGWTDSGGHGS